MKALSTRQPHAEAIIRGVKPIEFRSRPTTNCGRIYIYAALGRYKSDEETEMMKQSTCMIVPASRATIVGTFAILSAWLVLASLQIIHNRPGSILFE